MSEKFVVGEYVDITIRNAQITRVTPMNHGAPVLHVQYRGATLADELVLRASSEAVAVERVAPAEWPPQPGDLWRDRDGSLWFAFQVEHMNGAYIDLRCEEHSKATSPFDDGPTSVSGRFGPMVLVRREREPDWTWDDEDNPRFVTAPSGTVWDLSAKYRDAEGITWHWSGGFGRKGQDGPMRPLMSRDDYRRTDVQITAIPGPLTQVFEGGA